MTLYGNIHTWGSWKQWGVIYNANRARKEVRFGGSSQLARTNEAMVSVTL